MASEKNEKDQTPESVRELVERSSLGTPEAAALRATVSDEHAARIVALADSLEVWDDSVAPGGYVCTVCGIPTEDEPCAEHGPDAGPACPGCGHCCCPYKSEWQALGCAGESDVVRACELLRLPPEESAFKESECAPARGCGCMCHRPGGMAVFHFAPCCDDPPFPPEGSPS